ncbi:zinc-dependent peptidase [Winogradskyella sp. SYSU M77433]|uniref:zinc-dependent peptidase n=1 Tax=Winogradskyella sp. SYSU M77433 TaxID=3042722 RepID=UPI0024807340|nr:zinc-dependent peptidase [Winogradskyella sp. SYSU M77433]MDH7911539.1 zinc-dependent peptidase [Winogradskyella sp. SYSU M77433]
MIYFALIQDEGLSPIAELVLLVIFFVGIATIVLYKTFLYIEKLYALRRYKPFYINRVVFSDKLEEAHRSILESDFSFYQNLSKADKTIFRHRLSKFISDKTFTGREGIVPNDEMKILISSTAVMLTFGFRDYLIDLIEHVIIYPKAYYSKINDTLHKGEMNPQLKTIVFSWEDFKHGYKIGDDNLNLGIHEFGHAIHLNAYKGDDISSMIFNIGFENLTTYLQNNEDVRKELIASRYFREYAYTNQFEFFAVLLENFIETPLEFKTQFPELYNYIKQMLNFDFAHY